MKRFHVKLRFIGESILDFEDMDFYFDSFYSAKRCISGAFLHLDFAVGFLIYNNDVLIRIENRKEVFLHETQI